MEWLKALHLFSVIGWFAGIFYLPRLFVYHAGNNAPEVHALFKVMERRLYRFTSAFAVIGVLLGLWLLYADWHLYKSMGWMHLKLLLVVLLLVHHGFCGYFTARFARDANTRSARFYRWFNEYPALLLLGIVLLVIVRPF